MADHDSNDRDLLALGRKAKTARGRRHLKNKGPKAIENPKRALFIRGNKSSNEVNGLLSDLHDVRKPLGTFFSRKHPEQPFEDISGIEKMCNKLDHSLFCMGSSSKKRPFRLVLGRMFDFQLLDMQEYKVKNYQAVNKFRKKMTLLGSKPLVVFQGAAFETSETHKRAKSLLLDLFAGPKPEQILLEGMDSAVVISTVDAQQPGTSPSFFIRRYRLIFERSGSKLPHVVLEEVGPRFQLEVDRSRDPDRDRWKAALRTPKAAKKRVTKNVDTDQMGRKRGRIHVGKQDFDDIHTIHHGLSDKKESQLKDKLAKKRRVADKADDSE